MARSAAFVEPLDEENSKPVLHVRYNTGRWDRKCNTVKLESRKCHQSNAELAEEIKMPPSIKPCRTCRAAKQAAFLDPVADENSKAVLHIRYGFVVVLLAVAAFFW